MLLLFQVIHQNLLNQKKADEFSNNVLNFLIISLLGITLIVELFMPLFVNLIAPGFSENNEKFLLTTYLTRITFPFLFFISLASFFSAILKLIQQIWGCSSRTNYFKYNLNLNFNILKIKKMI